MPVPDAKTRNRISLNPSKVLSTSRIPSKLLPKIILSNVLFVSALHAGKEWLLDFDVGVFWVVMRVLACGGVGVLIWEAVTGQLAKRKTIEWSVLGTASLLVFVQQASLFTALFRLSSIRVIMFVQFSTLWIDALVNIPSTRRALAVVAAVSLCIVTDTRLFSQGLARYIPGYAALVVHGFSSIALDHTQRLLMPSLGITFTVAASSLGAAIFSLPFYIFRVTVLSPPPTPALPLISLAAIPFIAYSLLFLSPIVAQSYRQVSPIPQHFALSFPSTSLFAGILGPLAFAQYPSFSDLAVAALLYIGMYPESIDSFAMTPRTPTSRLARSYLKTILSNPESRKIFYFLMLNMSYMLVQMMYGVWTNSLGLISDAIHMAFDCMAIGVGLFASVMATWEPNERFTYGYGRIETLSGFANGIFLILISIFIVFEAIQRILDPPEMNTNQLLLVSSLGLAVNLFGMFAMGGHHHGHSHSHGHSHGQEEGHDHLHDHGHTHKHEEEHYDHGHTHRHEEEHHHSHDHSHTHLHDGHEQAQSRNPSASFSPPASPHSHSHSTLDSSHNDPHLHTIEDHHSHSHDQARPHSHSHPSIPPIPQISFPPMDENSEQKKQVRKKRHFQGGSLDLRHPAVHLMTSNSSPLTPNYRFGEDEHYMEHHQHAVHTPNVHPPSARAHSHEGHSDNMRGVFLHVMADTLGSVGVIISTLLIQFYGWTGFDPIASLFIALLISSSVIPLVIDTGKVLALGVNAARAATIQKALADLSNIEGLLSYTEPRFWPKDASTLIGSIHIQVAPSNASFDPSGPHSNLKPTYARIDRVVERVDSLLRERIKGLEELTIQVEKGNKLRK